MWYKNPNHKIVEQSKTIAYLEHRLENEQGYYSQLSDKAVRLEQALKTQAGEYEERLEAYNEELAHVGNLLVRREDEVLFLADALTETKAERDDFKLRLYDTTAAYQGYVRIVAKSDAEIYNSNQKIAALEAHLSDTLQQRDHAEGQLQLALGRNEGLADERTIIEATNDSLRQQIAAGEIEFDRLETSIKELKAELMPLRDSYANASRESREWYERWEIRGAKIVEHEKYIGALTRDNHRQVETIDKLQDELKQANAHDARQCDLIAEYKRDADRVDGLSYQLKEAKTEVLVQQGRADGLESALDDHLEKLANLKHDYDRKRDEAQALDSEVGSLHWQLDKQRDLKTYWGMLAVLSIVANLVLIGLPYVRAFTH